MMRTSGVDNETAVKALMPLVKGTVKNILELGTEKALTGPVARGDVQTVRKHLQALKGEDRMLEIYKLLSLSAADIAQSGNCFTPENGEKLFDLLMNFKDN